MYVGHTTVSLEDRFDQHKRDAAAKDLKKRCASYKVIHKGDAYIELLEDYPCLNKDEAHAREVYWMDNTKHCINAQTPGESNAKRTENAANYEAVTYAPIDTDELDAMLQTESGERLNFVAHSNDDWSAIISPNSTSAAMTSADCILVLASVPSLWQARSRISESDCVPNIPNASI